jgi:hypothetical protein
MPITPFLGDTKFDPETKRVMGVAFELAHIALGLSDRGDRANEMLAKRIIELAKAGERNPDILCEQALNPLAPVQRTGSIKSHALLGELHHHYVRV